VSGATQVYSREFDSVFFKLQPTIRELVEAKIQDLASRLATFPHHRLKGRTEFRLRAPAITESSTNSIVKIILCIWWRSVIAVTST
jgi:hypothetical protein